MSEAYLKRLRRLLLLLPTAFKAARQGRGVPLARAVEITGATSEASLLQDFAEVANLWSDPSAGEDAIDFVVEDGEVHVTYTLKFGTPPAFSLAEGAVLLAALEPYEKDGNKAAKNLVRKLRRAVPEPLRPAASLLARGLDLAARPPEPWATSLQQAISQRLEVTLEYRSVAEDSVAKRRVEPRLMFQRDGQWYLAAWNVSKGEEHLYRLDRLVSVEVGSRVFNEHKGPPVSRYVRRNLFFESGAEREVTLRFTGASARLALARHGARARENSDGSVSVTLRLTPGSYLQGLVLGYGGEASVEAPADVVEALRRHCAALARQYEGDPSNYAGNLGGSR